MTAAVNAITGNLSTTREMKKRFISQGVDWNLDHAFSDTDLYHFFRLRDVVLNQALGEGRIHRAQFGQIDDFRVNFHDQLLQFTIPGTKQKTAIAFEDVVHSSKAASALNYLIGRANEELFFGSRVPTIIKSNVTKSGATGPIPLQRRTAQARALPNSFAAVRQTIVPNMLAQTLDDVAARRKIVKRIEHAEFIVYRMKESRLGLPKMIEKRQEFINGLDKSDPRKGPLVDEVRQLRELLDQFKNIDTYALGMALTALPVGAYHHTQLDGVSTFVQNQVRADLEQRLGRSRLPWRKKALDQRDEAYIRGVAGLLHKSRGEYAMYCQKQGMRPERESLEDLILREAVRVADGGEFKGSEVKEAVVLSTMGHIKDKVVKLFDNLDMLSTVKRCFPQDDQVYSGDLTTLAELITARFERVSMDGNVVPSRGGVVSRALTSSLVVPAAIMATYPVIRWALPTNITSYLPFAGTLVSTALMGAGAMGQLGRLWSARSKLPALIGGTALAAGALALGAPSAADVLQSAMQNPALTVALVATTTRAVQEVYRYVCPKIGPATGPYTRRQRQADWGRLAKVAAGLAVGGTVLALSGMNVYRMVYPENEEDRSIASAYLVGLVNILWRYGAFAGFGIAAARKMIPWKSKGGTIGRVASKSLGILGAVASAGSTYQFARSVWNFISPTPFVPPKCPALRDRCSPSDIGVSPSFLEEEAAAEELIIGGQPASLNPHASPKLAASRVSLVAGAFSFIGSVMGGLLLSGAKIPRRPMTLI